MKRNSRVTKLQPIPKEILAVDVLTVKEYYLKHQCSMSHVYMTIDRVLAGTQKWGSFKAYRQGTDRIVIVEQKTKTNNKTATNENTNRKSKKEPTSGKRKGK